MSLLTTSEQTAHWKEYINSLPLDLLNYEVKADKSTYLLFPCLYSIAPPERADYIGSHDKICVSDHVNWTFAENSDSVFFIRDTEPEGNVQYKKHSRKYSVRLRGPFIKKAKNHFLLSQFSQMYEGGIATNIKISSEPSALYKKKAKSSSFGDEQFNFLAIQHIILRKDKEYGKMLESRIGEIPAEFSSPIDPEKEFYDGHIPITDPYGDQYEELIKRFGYEKKFINYLQNFV